MFTFGEIVTDSVYVFSLSLQLLV